METSQLPRVHPLENDLHSLLHKITANSLDSRTELLEFEHVMEFFPNPILITTPNGSIIYANPAWEVLTGYSCEEVQGKNPHILQSGKTPREVFTKMWTLLGQGKTFTTEDMINRKKDATEFQIQSTIFPIKKDGRTLFYVQVTQDITTRKKLEDLKKEFLSAATHELKTPITTLKLIVESQLRKLDKDIPLNIEEFKLVNRELDRLTRLIDDLADVARVETGKLNLILKKINLTDLITDVITQMSTIAEGRKIIQKYTIPLLVIADEDRIKQVLINLIKNAIKFSPVQSTITIISSTKKNQYAIVSVQDEGQGIAKEQIPFIFDRFYQINTNLKSGFGLGLYIAEEIIAQHKGKITVKSEPGKGSIFFFSLHLAQ